MPTLACIRPAVKALQDLGMHRKVQLIVSGGIRNGADVAKALALGADAVAIGTAALVALGDNDPRWEEEYQKLGTTAGAYDDWHEGKDPAGITTQDPELMPRVDPVAAGRRLANYLKVMTLEAQTIARACGKNHLHNLEPEDLVRADDRSGRHGAGAARRNELDTRQGRLLTNHKAGHASSHGQRRSKCQESKGEHSDTDLAKSSQKTKHQIFHDQPIRPVRRQRAKLVPAQAIADMQKTEPALPVSRPGSI
jgi:hypothetical protein